MTANLRIVNTPIVGFGVSLIVISQPQDSRNNTSSQHISFSNNFANLTSLLTFLNRVHIREHLKIHLLQTQPSISSLSTESVSGNFLRSSTFCKLNISSHLCLIKLLQAVVCILEGEMEPITATCQEGWIITFILAIISNIESFYPGLAYYIGLVCWKICSWGVHGILEWLELHDPNRCDKCEIVQWRGRLEREKIEHDAEIAELQQNHEVSCLRLFC